MKLDKETKDVMRLLIEDKIFIPKFKSLDISKFLDENKQLDLWLLEVAIRNSIRFMSHALGKKKEFNYVEGLPEYCTIRGLEWDSQDMRKEFVFFSKFIDSIVDDELYPVPEN